jgi:hypothetical protein
MLSVNQLDGKQPNVFLVSENISRQLLERNGSVRWKSCTSGRGTHTDLSLWRDDRRDTPREPEHQKQTEHELILGESHARSLPQDSTPEIDESSNTQGDAVHGREVL